MLVHGAFGFGPEWDPLVARLRTRTDLDFIVYEWRGPWSGLSRRVDELAAVLQAQVDAAGPHQESLIVIGHSAGAVIADYAARRLRVPARMHVQIVSIAAPPYLKVFAAPPLPPRVRVKEYIDAGVGHDRSLDVAAARFLGYL